jgi:type I site-specific restriction-modification system R (restriction) subunit
MDPIGQVGPWDPKKGTTRSGVLEGTAAGEPINNALARLREVRASSEALKREQPGLQTAGQAPAQPAAKLGVFWHAQGSGKTVSMIFFTQKVLRTMAGNWTFVVVTDRDDLDDQAHKEFAAAGILEDHVRATSARHCANS